MALEQGYQGRKLESADKMFEGCPININSLNRFYERSPGELNSSCSTSSKAISARPGPLQRTPKISVSRRHFSPGYGRVKTSEKCRTELTRNNYIKTVC